MVVTAIEAQPGFDPLVNQHFTFTSCKETLWENTTWKSSVLPVKLTWFFTYPTLPLSVIPLMLDDNGTSLTVTLILAAIGVIWYVVLWAIGLLGCFAG